MTAIWLLKSSTPPYSKAISATFDNSAFGSSCVRQTEKFSDYSGLNSIVKRKLSTKFVVLEKLLLKSEIVLKETKSNEYNE